MVGVRAGGRPWRGVLAAASGLVLACGCGSAEPTVPIPDRPRPVLVIGLIPEQNVFAQIERYEPLAGYLSRRIGSDIRLRVLPRYGNIIDSFRSSGMDGAFFGSFTYALAHERLGLVAIARPVYPDGTSTYHGLLFVRRDSGIRTARDMRGKRFVFVDKATTAGYLLPLDYFYRNGIRDYRTWFRETYFAGTHEDAILDVIEGRADAGAAKNTVFRRVAASDPRVGRDLVILERSPDVPENGLALSSEVDETVREAIARTLLGMDQDPEGIEVLGRFGVRKFIVTRNEDYATVYRYAEEIGLDLASYDYRNDR